MVKSTTKLQIDDFGSTSKQLEIIDKLRELGVGDEISLPQLVVVGDQSSGKSSLLEGLTSLPFPVASQLCTRFATQVSFRRSASSLQDIYNITIIPAADSGDEYKLRVGKYTHQLTELSAEAFGKILDEAATCMGLVTAESDSQSGDKRFSSDVLKIEIVGPKQPHLSVVDVPGLYHNPTKEQTIEDLAIIRALIEHYVQDQRTIIMAVLDSRNNLANQEVFRIAKSADPDGRRTIGIMTKLDALQPGDEPAAIKIARNETEVLKHGWYCVRNRSTQEINEGVSIAQRHANEKAFFDSTPWTSIDRKRTGIGNLKANLGRLLSSHIAREFPDIRREIDERYRRCQMQLRALGPPRETHQEQMQFLTRLATAYQRRIEDVSNGRYAASGMHPSKLRMHLQNASTLFGEKMTKEGHTLSFKSTNEEYDVASDEEQLSQDLERLVIEDQNDTPTNDSNIYRQITALWRTSRGTELPGHVNPSVIENLFRYQTSKWNSIATEHLENMFSITKSCNEDAFSTVCVDESIRSKLEGRISSEVDAAFESANAELSQMLDDERNGPLLTNNRYFVDNLNKARSERAMDRLKKLGFVDDKDFHVDFSRMMSTMHLSNEISTIYDIHDTLKAYYEVALKRFIDNVANQVVERNLMGRKGPVNIFNPEYVAGFSTEELAFVAGEDFETLNLRAELKSQISRLEDARKICSGRAMVA